MGCANVSAEPHPAADAKIGFTYGALDSETAAAAQAAAERIRDQYRSAVKGAIETGRDLIAIKNRLDHGQFGAWLAAEFDMADRTARNYMAAAEAFAAKSDTVSVLPMTSMYALAAPATPPENRAILAVDMVRTTAYTRNGFD